MVPHGAKYSAKVLAPNFGLWCQCANPPYNPPLAPLFGTIGHHPLVPSMVPSQWCLRGTVPEAGADGPTARGLAPAPLAVRAHERRNPGAAHAKEVVTVEDFMELEVSGPEPWHSVEYTSYMQSPAWQRKRLQILNRSGGRCETCGRAATQVHHLTYERLGNEYMSDLLAVCEPCHDKHDAVYRSRVEQERRQRRMEYQQRQESYEQQRQRWEEEAARRKAEREYEVELNRWATKRYGSAWKLWRDREKTQREFDAWIADRRRWDGGA